jgi:hypothetical protein
MNSYIPEYIRIPKLDLKNKMHQRLAEFSMQAPEATKKGDTVKVADIEKEVDRQSAQFWSLTDAELAEIQRSLKELTE